jgi:hypothetical protein
MKLEKDRLAAKVDNLEASLAQIKDEAGAGGGLGEESQFNLKNSPTKTNVSSKMGGSPPRKGSSAAINQGKKTSMGNLGSVSVAKQTTVIRKTDP